LVFQEVSAKTGMNVNNLFYKDIFDQIGRKYNLGGIAEVEYQDNNFKDSNKSNENILFFKKLLYLNYSNLTLIS